jgi:hypothetical protein
MALNNLGILFESVLQAAKVCLTYERKARIEPDIYIPAVQVADRLWVAMLTYAGGDTSAAMPAYTA